MTVISLFPNSFSISSNTNASQHLIGSSNLSQNSRLIFNKIKYDFANRLGDDEKLIVLSNKILEKKWDEDLFIKGLKLILKETSGFGNDSLKIESDSILLMDYAYQETSSGLILKEKEEGFYYKRNIFHQNFIFGKWTLSDGTVHEGKWEYIPELGAKSLVEGKVTWPNGTVYEGKSEYITKLGKMSLVDGKVRLPSETVIEGKWEYIPELKSMFLVDGKVTWSNGTVHEGKRKYISELKSMHFVDGKKTWQSGEAREGKMKYIPELKEMALVVGEVTWPDGQIEKGKFQFIPELKNLSLVDGEITWPDGTIEKRNLDI